MPVQLVGESSTLVLWALLWGPTSCALGIVGGGRKEASPPEPLLLSLPAPAAPGGAAVAGGGGGGGGAAVVDCPAPMPLILPCRVGCGEV